MASAASRVKKQLELGDEECMVVTFLSNHTTMILPAGYYKYDRKNDEHHTWYPKKEDQLKKLLRSEKGPFHVDVLPKCKVPVHLVALADKPIFRSSKLIEC
jgi:hypothetical protein